MTSLLLFNGDFHDASSPLISPSNSGFRFGEGLFETIRITSGSPQLLSYHFERLMKGMQALDLEAPRQFTATFFEEQVRRLFAKHHYDDARVRFTVYSASESLPAKASPINWIIQCYPLPPEYLVWNEEGYRVDICEHIFKANDILSNHKTNNYLPFLYALRQARKNELQDMLILNHEGNIVESCIANVFLVKDEMIITPPLTDGPVAGVMRRHLMENLPALGFNLVEKSIKPDLLEDADELFLTNALTGIRWVSGIRQKTFQYRVSRMIYSRLFERSK